jgi:biopolymer transport protein ExbD
VVNLNANGSLIVSQRDRAEGGVITLPSIQALPAEIDALVPRKEERRKIAFVADPTLPWRDFITLMYDATKAGFDQIGILGPEKEPRGGPSELVVRLSLDVVAPDISSKTLFVSVTNDGYVILCLGLGPEATGVRVNLAGAADAAVGLVPNGRAEKETYFRANLETLVGDAFKILRALDAIGFTKVNIVAETPR